MPPREDLHLDPELIALLALGEMPGSPEEVARTTSHLASCGHCASEVDELAAVARQARQSAPLDTLVEPPAEVWAAIRAQLDEPAAELPTTTARVVPIRRTSWLSLAAAACVGLVVGGGAVLAATSGARDAVPVASASPSVIATAALSGVQGSSAKGSVEVVATSSGPRVLVDVTGLAKPDGYYEVWLLDRKGDKLVALGALDGAAKGSFAMPPGVAMTDFPVVDVSLESSDGDPAHSHHSLVRGTLPA